MSDNVAEIIRVAEFDTPIGPIRFATSEKGLAHIALPHASGRGLGGWISSQAHAAKIREDADANHAASLQVIEYLEGERVVFELPLDLRGTEFQLAAFEEIATIPYGESRSYRELAASLGNPNSMRAVGAAAGAVLAAVTDGDHVELREGGRFRVRLEAPLIIQDSPRRR